MCYLLNKNRLSEKFSLKNISYEKLTYLYYFNSSMFSFANKLYNYFWLKQIYGSTKTISDDILIIK